MKRILFCLSLACCLLTATAQTQLSKYQPGVTTDGAIYYLPKTAMHFMGGLLKHAASQGAHTKGGIEMLLLQAIEAYDIWTQ